MPRAATARLHLNSAVKNQGSMRVRRIARHHPADGARSKVGSSRSRRGSTHFVHSRPRCNRNRYHSMRGRSRSGAVTHHLSGGSTGVSPVSSACDAVGPESWSVKGGGSEGSDDAPDTNWCDRSGLEQRMPGWSRLKQRHTGVLWKQCALKPGWSRLGQGQPGLAVRSGAVAPG